MSEVTFANFNPETHSVYDIGGDVLPQMAEVFGHNLTDNPDVENLGELTNIIGPAKTLHDNIDKVVGRIGDTEDAVDLARSWVERSGLMIPVNRSFLSPDIIPPVGSDIYLITGGVANWMHRRADALITEVDCIGIQIGKVILAGGNRVMKGAERDDVMDGEREDAYMRDVIRPKLVKAGLVVEQAVMVNSGDGNEVADKLVEQALSHNPETVAVVSNAGAWVQNAGQIGRAIKRNRDASDEEVSDVLFVQCDEFPVGTGEEPTSTHQNPFSALGQIVRNAQEFVRWQS